MEMRSGKFSSWLLSATLAFILSGTGPGCRSEDTLRGYLPGDRAADGWMKYGETQEFVGEDLYTYIDGGAEIYQEYGFRRVVIQDYKNASGKSVSLEIFEMEAPSAAFGMFTFKRSGKGRPVPLGSGAELDSYYMNFWKGRFLATLTGFDEAPETITGLTAVAGVVDSKISDAGKTPDLAAALPEEGLQRGSVKYFKGLLGLNNTYPFYSARGLSFIEAVRGTYENGATLLVLEYGTAEVRAKEGLDLEAYLSGSDRFEPAGSGDADAHVFKDGKDQYLALAPSGTRLLIGISPDPAASTAVVGQSR